MTINEYQNEAMRIASGMNQNYPIIVNGLMGLNGEAGEAIDILKKHLFQDVYKRQPLVQQLNGIPC